MTEQLLVGIPDASDHVHALIVSVVWGPATHPLLGTG